MARLSTRWYGAPATGSTVTGEDGRRARDTREPVHNEIAYQGVVGWSTTAVACSTRRGTCRTYLCRRGRSPIHDRPTVERDGAEPDGSPRRIHRVLSRPRRGPAQLGRDDDRVDHQGKRQAWE
jgi:hypothetical protein